MNSDATEAALGLLGLSPLNAPQSHPHPQPRPHHHVVHTHGPSLTSSSVGIAVDRTSTPPIFQSTLSPSLVPLKRKQPSPALSPTTAVQLIPPISRDADALSSKSRQSSHPLATSSTPPIKSNRLLSSVSAKSLPTPSQRQFRQPPFSPIPSGSIPPQTSPTSQLPLASPPTLQHSLALSDVPPPPDSDAISCICGLTYDDGFSIACDDCSRWCHAACFGIVQGGEVPEFWKCWVCDPTLEVDRERAVKTQKGRFKAMRMKTGANGGTSSVMGGSGNRGSPAVDETSSGVGKPASRRKTSPGSERKSRRGSAVAAAIEGSGSSRKKRRASMLSPSNPLSPSIPSTSHNSTQLNAHSTRISHPSENGLVASSNLPSTPITFPPDIYPNPAVYSQLLRVAKAWRGVTALNPPSPFVHPPPNTYNDGVYTRVDSQGYRDQYGYSMSPLDNTTPVIMDRNAADVYVPRTVLRTDPSVSPSNLVSGPCTHAHLRPPSPRLHVASDPSPFSHTVIYPSPPISNYMSTPVSSSSHPRPYIKSPLTPSTNILSTTHPNDTIPATTLLAPYTAAIVPSAAYLADPLNGYAHLGMGKPQVRLVGGGWEVGLDARGISPDSRERNGVGVADDGIADGKTRWARCGCWPNAVVRPVICGKRNGQSGKGMRHNVGCAKAVSHGNPASEVDVPLQTVNGTTVPPISPQAPGQQTDNSSNQDEGSPMPETEVDPTSLSFALFALRDLKAGEEIVLGWEWDDGHAVHMLPALMESPGLFAPAHLQHLRAQFTSTLHALSSTFTTCACGSSTRDCAVRIMEQVVDGHWPWPGGEMMSDLSDGESSEVNCASDDSDDGDVDVEGDGLPGSRPSHNWGLGVNVDVDIEMESAIEVDGRTRRVKKRKVRKKTQVEDPMHVNNGREASGVASSSSLQPKTMKAIDLGPLVGVKRGFRTRERVPLNGGWGGVEIVPSSLKAFPEVGIEEDLHVGGKGKGKARANDDEGNTSVTTSQTTLPPRMRKVWSREPVSQIESLQENPSRGYSIPSESWRAHERWRSPSDTVVESPISVSGVPEGSISDDRRQDGVSGEGEDGTDGQETDFDTETETDGLDDTRQMPPPPMPASLDPTTVSSLAHAQAASSASPRGSVQWDKSGVSATRTPQMLSSSVSSERSSQTPTPGQGSCSAPHSTVTRSLLASQADYCALSPSMSLSPAAQSPVQSHPSPLIPGVSPSTTFSKLSLHSPDASSMPNLSVLCGPNESTSEAARDPDNRASSPPHRPSKPLHVHPQNEPPSFPTPLCEPVVILDSPDGIRDTPAETLYQQPHRSSPEPGRKTHPTLSVEKQRPSNGDVHHVRFASPEILNGMPQLKGKTASDNSKPLDAHRVTFNAAGTVEGKNPLDCDVMDVEVDVIGDNQAQDGSGSSHATSPGGRTNHVTEGHMLCAPGSPSQAPPDSQPQTTVAVEDGTAPADDSPTASNTNETTSQVEPMTIDPTPPQPQEPSLPPPKVKMSLKDFALRKKKQREEEMAAKALKSPASHDSPTLPPSPNIDVKCDFPSEHVNVVPTSDFGEAANGKDVKMVDVKKGVLDSSETAHVNMNGFDGGKAHGDDTFHTPSCISGKVMAQDDKRSAMTPSPSKAIKTLETLAACPSVITSRVSRVRNNTDQIQTQVDGKLPMALNTKMEIMDTLLPNGLVGTDDRTPDVVSFAPDPPPPLLTIKQASEMMTIDHTAPSCCTSGPPWTPVSTMTSTSMSTSTSAVNSRSNSVGIPSSALNANSPPHTHIPSSSSSVPSSRRPSHEDGEITNSTPPKTYLPRSHTPPTQPRSFATVHPSPPSFGSTSSSAIPIPRRPVPPLSRSPLSNNTCPTPPPTSRPLPSGPRALRGSMTQSAHSYVPSRPSYGGSQYIPRGPSADRDRMDWERSDRQWAPQARARGRAGSNGWGR